MKVDCHWFGANLEGFFGDSLSVEELQLAREHVNSCISCRNEVQALRDVDPLVKQVFEFRMAKARMAANAPKRSLGFHIGLAGGVVALAAAVIFAVYLRPTGVPAGVLPVTAPALQSSETPNLQNAKGDGSEATLRAKPGVPDQPNPTRQIIPEAPILDGAPEFAVIDPSGYATNLQDYRGRVLLMGMWGADHPETAQNLQRLYQAFGTRRELRILGVTRRSQDRLPGTTFPIVFNNGSRLLEARNADYVIVDKEGRVQMRGSLEGDAVVLVSQIRAKLDQLGGR